MRDRGRIWTGLALFLVFFTWPIWHNLYAHVTTKGPEPVLPKGQKLCVAPVGYMRTSHMELLLSWRNAVVRQGLREYRTADGRPFTMTLTGTCLRQCHTAKADFCDRCHNYTASSPTCWECHQDSKVTLGSVR
jgi:hypothetical protein